MNFYLQILFDSFETIIFRQIVVYENVFILSNSIVAITKLRKAPTGREASQTLCRGFILCFYKFQIFFQTFSFISVLFLFSFDRIFLLSGINAKVTKISRKTPKCFFQFSISQRLGFSGSGGIAHFFNFI